MFLSCRRSPPVSVKDQYSKSEIFDINRYRWLYRNLLSYALAVIVIHCRCDIVTFMNNNQYSHHVVSRRNTATIGDADSHKNTDEDARNAVLDIVAFRYCRIQLGTRFLRWCAFHGRFSFRFSRERPVLIPRVWRHGHLVRAFLRVSSPRDRSYVFDRLHFAPSRWKDDLKFSQWQENRNTARLTIELIRYSIEKFFFWERSASNSRMRTIQVRRVWYNFPVMQIIWHVLIVWKGSCSSCGISWW